MNFHPTLAAVCFTLGLSISIHSAAEPKPKKLKSKAVQDAIQKFNSRDKATPNEVTAVLDADEPPPAAVPVAKDAESPENAAVGPAVKVTGKPPTDADATAISAPEAPDLTLEPPKPAEELAVRIEKVQSGNGTIDPTQVTLTAPFPAKPLNAIPTGWHLDISRSAPPFIREVELAPGSPLTLTIHPHVLVPDADRVNVFTIPEPGYHHPLGYRQTGTVGAILAGSIRQLDEDSKKLGNAIDNLQQLLISLPKPDREAKPATFRQK